MNPEHRASPDRIKRLSITVAVVGMLFFAVAFLHTRESQAIPVPDQGKPAPSFQGTDQNGETHALSDYHGHWLVLYFFPKADTPGCTKEACAFRDGIFKLGALGADVVGVSMDTRNRQEKFARKYHIPFPLLADHSGTIARAYGAAGGFLNLDHRYTFLISPQGVLVKRYLDVDPDRHAGQILKDLKALGAREAAS